MHKTNRNCSTGAFLGTAASEVNRKATTVAIVCAAVLLALMSMTSSWGGALADERDIESLLEGVAEIGAPGWTGSLCVYGPDAFPVVAGATNETSAPVAAAGRWASGRVVALGDRNYFGRATIATGDTARFLRNALRWVGAGNQRIGVVTGNGAADQLLEWLVEEGFDAAEAALGSDSLADIGIVTVDLWDQSDAEIDALQDFVRDGGGLVAVATAWAWADYLHPELDIVEDFPGNRLFAAAGIQWAHGVYPTRTSPAGYAAEGPPDVFTHALAALEGLEAHETGSRTLTPSEVVQAVSTLESTMRCLPRGDQLLAPRLRTLLESKERRWPTEEEPVATDDILDRLAAVFYVTEHQRTEPRSVRAHPAAADFPGAVPAEAPRITRRFELDLTASAEPTRRGVIRPQQRWPSTRWHSTGLYAAPGEQVVVTVPRAVADAGTLFVQVGVHDMDLWTSNEWWHRMPAVTRRFAISEPTTPVANAFGGLIYVQSPFEVELGRVTVEVAGAVAAPRFVLGETDPVAWRDEIRHAPAPWAEIEGRNMIVTTVSEEVRRLDDPGAVAEVWDEVLDLNAELAAWVEPDVRVMRERFVVDRQLPYGGMLAGYPLRAHLDQQAHLVDALFLRTCQKDWRGSIWGMYHEVGHIHQSDYWTFDGTGEVTVNLFTLYVHEFLCGLGLAATGWSPGPSEQLKRHDFKLQHLPPFKREPSLGLHMYTQLLEEFGWDAFRQTFAEYLRLPEEELPANDEEKRDQWLTRFSGTVGRNLAPFFEAWGVSTSHAAKEEVASLPAWLPPASGFPIRPVARLGDLNDDGNDDVLLRHIDGRWQYVPMNGRRQVAAGRGAADLPADSGWIFVGIGDFDGVQGDEVLLRYEDGRWRRQPMDGRRQRDEPAELPLPRSRDWRLAAVGDFDGDGSDDVLLRHVAGHWWLQPMRDGIAVPDGGGRARIPGSLDYRLEGVGDFDGDGNDDVLLRHVEGSWFYYPMDGRDNAGARVRTDLPDDLKWRLAGVGDFDADGSDDVLLRNWDSGVWHHYRSADGGLPGSGVAGLPRNSRYGIAGVGDLDGDGKDDLLLRRNDGVWYYYAMDGLA